MILAAIASEKQRIREHVWSTLDRAGAVHPGSRHGKIPNFIGAEEASNRLAATTAWASAGVIKSNPDKAQFPIRLAALQAGKIVYMAVPKIASLQPFYYLNPATLGDSLEKAASPDTAADVAGTVAIEDIQHIDIAILGSVAVNRSGTRIGKGAGYADLELALLAEAGAIDDQTLIVTTVHPLQVLDTDLPEAAAHDIRCDLVITPEETIECPRTNRRPKIIQDHLTPETAAIPVLQNRMVEGH